MVVRRWVSGVGVATGTAAAAGAAQLGLAYGIGVIAWPPRPGGAAEQAWVASLAWACWIATTSTVAGAVIADRLRLRQDHGTVPQASTDPRVERLLWRLTLGTAAAVGAMLTVVLVAVPARDAAAAGVSAPQAQAAGYALVGVLAGVVVAVAVLAARAAATNLILTATWLWLLAAAGVAQNVISGREWSRVPLGFWELDFGEFALDQPVFRGIAVTDAAMVLGASLLVGVLAALPAARRGENPAGVVVSGVTGPVVLALAYLLAQPDLTGATATDLSRHLVVPYAIVAGLAGSLLASGFGTRPRPEVTPDAPAAAVPAPRQGADRRQNADASKGGGTSEGGGGKRQRATKREKAAAGRSG